MNTSARGRFLLQAANEGHHPAIAACVSQRLQVFTQTHTQCAAVCAAARAAFQPLPQLRAESVELRGHTPLAVVRLRRFFTQILAHRVARQRGLLRNLANRLAVPVMPPPDLAQSVHGAHSSSLPLVGDGTMVSGGSNFDENYHQTGSVLRENLHSNPCNADRGLSPRSGNKPSCRFDVCIY